jgi:hydrophobe/amphiphile efflux-1 (HAE1) family protein
VKFSHFMIDRPVFAVVIAVLITLLGAIAYPNLGAAQYPEIVPPTVNVTLTYAGASAETIAETVADPLEEQINGVEDMIYMSSNSTGDGNMQITVTFKLGTDLDKAQELVQNRVTTALPRLPTEVQSTGITVRKSSPDILMAVHMYSPDGSLDQQYVANYVTLQIEQPLLRVPGVGDVSVRAARDYAIRVWIDPDKAAARNLTVDDIVNALRSHNVQVAAGNIGAPPFGKAPSAYQLQVQAQGRLVTPQQFADIVVKRDAQNRITRVSDVARVELGAENYTTNAYLGFLKNGKPEVRPAAAIGVLQQPGTNALDAANGVIKEMKILRKSFPPGLDYQIIYNPTQYISQSIDEVYKTLFEALVLVVIVVMIFLQSWRAALIPIIAIPVSLIGTFAVMLAAHFTLNNLTLFGLVLAIGIVVDDAIVVVENVERHLDEGMSPRDAAHTTMDEVGGALIAIALVLASVFIPAAFISGISGQFYRQFALTIATATVISLIVSLTLSPAMAALLLKPKKKEGEGEEAEQRGPRWRRTLGGLGDRFNRGFDKVAGKYAALTKRLIAVSMIMLIVYACLIGLTVWRLGATPNGFIPSQDQGNVIMAAQLPEGSSLARTDAFMRRVVPMMLTQPGVVGASTYAGVDASTQTTNVASGQSYVIESSFEDRKKKHVKLADIIGGIQKSLGSVPGAMIRILPPPPVRGIGTQGGVKMIVEDRSGKADYGKIQQVAESMVTALHKSPEVTGAFETFNTGTPRIFAQIDREKAEYLGVPDSAVFDTLQTYLGSTFINDFNYLNHTYQVYAQADAPFRQDESEIGQLQTRSANGAMMPLAAVVNIKRITGPYRVYRYQLYPSAEVQANTPPGHSTGQTMKAMEAIALKTLPPGFHYEWTELAYQQQAAGNTSTLVFVLAVVLVFLLLAALYESVTMPLAVVLIVPMCLLAAITGVNIMGMDNNILTQIGFIVLIGLAAKNAILIVEFARQGEIEQGQDRVEAASEAARTRLRPILMTSFAFILGVIPLAFAAGAGAELRRALGVAVFFGMIGVTVFGLVFTPVFYVVTRKLGDRIPQPPTAPKTAGDNNGALGESKPEPEPSS